LDEWAPAKFARMPAMGARFYWFYLPDFAGFICQILLVLM
jgi:hypothetical protein